MLKLINGRNIKYAAIHNPWGLGSLQTHLSHVREKHSSKVVPVKQTSSFVHKIFRGILDQTQVTPYPDVLDNDQIELLKMLLDQAERVITVINDPLKNDQLEAIPEDTLTAKAVC